MASVKKLNPNADITRSSHALLMNISAAKGLQNVLRSNLGPKGTMKMLVGGAGDIKLTKDGNILLHEMQIQHPTASLIARAATAQDDITGDGTTSSVLIIGECLKQCERFLSENVHPRVLADGFDAARIVALKTLDEVKIAKTVDKELLLSVARTSLRTKVPQKIADQLTEIVTDAIMCVQKPEMPIDLHMVEVMTMQHRSATDTRLVRGIVLDHGPRHPRMPTKLQNCHILTCNISLEFEKSEVNAGFFYRSAEHRQSLADAERKFTDSKVLKIIELKREVCKPGESFVILNMKGIDPVSLDMLANENILALRRAKRRNMERLTLCCGGAAVNSEEGLIPEVLGFAKEVTVSTLGDEKFTFVEGVSNPRSCTILIKGPDGHTISQIKDSVRDGLRAVKNTIDDQCVVPGGGAFELAAHRALVNHIKTMKGRTKLGVQAFADALLVIPKTLAANSGFDPQDTIISMLEEHDDGHVVGVDVSTGEPFDPDVEGVYDNFRVKRQQLQLSSILASQLLLVDEVMRAGKSA